MRRYKKIEFTELTVKNMFTGTMEKLKVVKNRRELPKGSRIESEVWVDTYATLNCNTLYEVHRTPINELYAFIPSYFKSL